MPVTVIGGLLQPLFLSLQLHLRPWPMSYPLQRWWFTGETK
jgi:hypothetical protein